MLRKGGGRLVYIEGGWIWRLQLFLPQPKNFTPNQNFHPNPKYWVVDVEGGWWMWKGGWWMWREGGGCGGKVVDALHYT